MQKKFIVGAIVLGLLAAVAMPIFAQTIENLTPEQRAVFLQVLASEISVRKDMANPQVAGAYAVPGGSYVPQPKPLLFVKPQVLGAVAISSVSRCGDGICGTGEVYSTCPTDCGKGATLPGYGTAGATGYNPTMPSTPAAGLAGSASYTQDVCNKNLQCEDWRGENYTNCPTDCTLMGSGRTGTQIKVDLGVCNYNNLCEPLKGENYTNCPSDCKTGTGTIAENPPYPGWMKCEVCGKWYDPKTQGCPDTCNQSATASGEAYTKQQSPITLPPETKDGNNVLRGSVSKIEEGGEPGFIVYDPTQPQTRGSQIGGVQIGGVQSGLTSASFAAQGNVRINVSGFVSATYDQNTKIFSTLYSDPNLLPGKTRAYRAAIRFKSSSLSGGYAYIEAQNEQYIYGQQKILKPGECPCDDKDEFVCYDVAVFSTTTKNLATSTVDYKNSCVAACEINKARRVNPTANYTFKKSGKCQVGDSIKGKDVTAPFKVVTVGPAQVKEIGLGEAEYSAEQKRYRVKLAMRVEDFGSMQSVLLLSNPLRYNKTKTPSAASSVGEAKNISENFPQNVQVQLFEQNKNLRGTWFTKPGDGQNRIEFEAIISENGEHCFIAQAYAMRDYKPGDIYLSNLSYAQQYLVNASNEVCVKIEGIKEEEKQSCSTINGKQICVTKAPICDGKTPNCTDASGLTVTTTLSFEELSITQVEKPEVFTLEATNITTNSAVLRGKVTKLGGTPLWGEDDRYAKRETFAAFSGLNIKETPGQKISAPGVYEFVVKELRPGTEYCFNAIAWLQKAGAVANPMTEYGFAATGITVAKEKGVYGQQVCFKTQFGDALEKAESSDNPNLELEKMGYKTNLNEFGVDWNNASKGLTNPFTIGALILGVNGQKLENDTMYGSIHKTDLEKQIVSIPVVGFAFQRGTTANDGAYSVSSFGGANNGDSKTYFVVVGRSVGVGKDDYLFNFKMPSILAGASFDYYPFAIYDGRVYTVNYPGKISAAADKTFASADVKALENGELQRAAQKGYYAAELRGEVLKIGSSAQYSGLSSGFAIISPDDPLVYKTYSGYIQGSRQFNYPGSFAYKYSQIRSGYKYCYKVTASQSNSSVLYSQEEICFTAPVEEDWKADVYVAPTSTAWKDSEETYAQTCAKCGDIINAPRPPNPTYSSAGTYKSTVCGSDNKTYEKECFQYYCTKAGLSIKSYGNCPANSIVKSGVGASNITAYNQSLVARVAKTLGSEGMGLSDTAQANIYVFIKAIDGDAYVKKSGAFVVGLYETSKGRISTISTEKITYNCGNSVIGNSYKISSDAAANCNLNIKIEPISITGNVGKYYVKLESILWTQTESGVTKVLSVPFATQSYFSTIPVDLIYRSGLSAQPTKRCVCTTEYAPVCAIPPGFTRPQVYPNNCYAQCDSASVTKEYQVISNKCVYVNYNR